MQTKQWGNVWEDKIKSQKNEVSIIHGNNSSMKRVNEELSRRMSFFDKWMLPLIPKNGNILDCGVGPMARFSIEFAKRGYKVTGVDISKTTLDYAKKWIKRSNQKIKLIQDDLTELNKINQDFDLVFCIQTFGHIPSYLALETLSKFNSKLKKNGLCYISFWLESEKTTKQLVKGLAYQLAHKIRKKFVKSYSVNCSTYTHEEIKDIAKRTGFKVLKNNAGEYLLQKI